ncbi:hypothetical protein [Carboxylicivirga caseinilyticus]|uniref:hypothetical protein n=1 Tax=Carboxylicivirga caseinilyticus TaxID=3417572 RepID=UPI002AA77F9A|nr:hypothetical protein [uncultured Carboxylicivirga sp.]MCU4162662.1 hypothetical protein [Marinilabiliaceae bacterium A049]
MTKLSKILNIVLYLLLAITLVFAAMFFFGGEVEGAAYTTPVYTNAFLNWGILLVFLTGGITLLAEVFNLVMHPKNAVRTLISMGLLLIVVLVSYALADTTPLDIIGYQGPDNVPSMLAMAGTMLYGMYILFGVAVIAILYSELSRLFK